MLPKLNPLTYNKAWIAGIAAPLIDILYQFATVGLGIPETVLGMETHYVVTALVTGLIIWAVPNKALPA